MSLINKVYTAQDMRDAAKCLFACEVDLKHDNRDIAKMLRQAADMMDRADDEAAAKRERETTSEKSSQVGNAAAMREALVIVKRLFDGLLMWQTDIRKAHEAVNAALAEPPRNCDVGTVKEQSEMFFEFCTPKRCDECKVHEDDSFYRCVLRWCQMPYEEEKA